MSPSYSRFLSTAALFINCFFITSVMWGAPSSAVSETAVIPPLEWGPHGQSNPQLCGVNCLYLALRFLGDQKSDYESLLRAFPEAIRSGLSLSALKRELEGRGYHGVLDKLSERELASLPQGRLAIVLSKGEHGNHLSVKVPAVNGLKIVDPPNVFVKSLGECTSDSATTCLLISKDKFSPEKFFGSSQNSTASIIAMSAGMLILALSMVRNQKRNAS